MTNQTAQLHHLADLLLQLELALRNNGFWQQQPPSPAAMASRLPFCADTLEFSQWLQFVFLPRMQHLIENNEPLPDNSNITAMAQEAWSEGAENREILQPIRAIDAVLTSRRGNSNRG
ncbi:MAG TPA: YqcC family protein [Salinisphaeraceae bacterium]|nr:YqcC family protein [Salinisphaeraceae bacterium]